MKNRDNLHQTDTSRDKGTDVLSENVSRDTSPPDNIYAKHQKKKADLDKVRQKGGISDDNPFDFNNPTLKELYADFRRNKLSVVESAYNALYLWCYDNYYSSGVPIKDKYKGIYAHPSAWFRHTHHMWKHNKWSIAIRIMEILPSATRLFEKTNKATGNHKERLFKAFEYSHHSARKAISFFGYLLAIAGIAGTILLWHSNAQQLNDYIPALKLYIDGNYVGNVLSVSDAQSAKARSNNDLSVRFGFPYSLDYELTFEPTKIREGENLNHARLSAAFGKAADSKLVQGYGLYSDDNRLLLVSPEKSWLEECRQELIQQGTKQSKNSGEYFSQDYDTKGTYPKELMVSSLDELKKKFSLIPTQEEDTNGESDSVSMDGNIVGTTSDIGNNNENSVSAIISKTQINSFSSVTEYETIPHGTKYEYSDKLAENKRVLTSSGKDGSKRATYFVTYDADGNEIDRKLYDEVVISQPENQIITLGTRPLTQEELRTKSTGTYILPTSGPLSSGYGWRSSFNEFHKGVDMCRTSDADLDIVASDGGVVIEAGDRNNGYGLCILIEHDDGTQTKYAHCAKLYVEEGQMVAQGEKIAMMGTTGWSTGVHLHFEIIRDGEFLNPEELLPYIRRS